VSASSSGSGSPEEIATAPRRCAASRSAKADTSRPNESVGSLERSKGNRRIGGLHDNRNWISAIAVKLLQHDQGIMVGGDAIVEPLILSSKRFNFGHLRP
jgi:hypothetical protein